MDEEAYKKTLVSVVIVVLLGLSFFLIKPILTSAFLGVLLAFLFMPLYNWLNSKINSKDISAYILCGLLIVILFASFWFLTPIFVNQSVKLYLSVQKVNFVELINAFFSKFLSSIKLSSEIGPILQNFITRSANSVVTIFSNLVFDFPNLVLQSFVVFFTFFFMLRDHDQFIAYLRSLLPFSEEVEKKLFKQSKDITLSVLYGQVVVGIGQGLLAGVGFFIFGVPNAILMTLLAMIMGILPIVGTPIVWVPVSIYLITRGKTFAAAGVIFFGILSSTLDNIIRPAIISKKSEMHSALVLFGMVGGIFLFGVLGIILGPLILAYLLIIVEAYRNKKSPGIFSVQVK